MAQELSEPIVLLLETDFPTDRTVEVVAISYPSSGLEVTLESIHGRALVTFPKVTGFRVLDEGDLSEFWTKCSLKEGWLFEVHQGGWKDLELKRPYFVSGLLYPLREYLIVGFDLCVSVLSHDTPSVSCVRPP